MAGAKRDNHGEQEQEPEQRQPRETARRQPTLRQWESVVDRAIREAQERGEFDNLTTAGKPLKLGKPWDPDWGMAHHILKQAGETLPWIALDKEIRERRDRLWAQLERAAADLRETSGQPGWWERRRVLRERYLKEAEELDKLMAEFNHQVPIRRLDKGRLPPHIAAERFDKACPPGDEVLGTEY